ncbi:hypothetical protein ACHHYP_12294 [Achlya hypogyna]|uniref:Uncharacterized protein n=1 Tax=Achlya hypogyna TaxID=1202772 RepID=A0A1V9YHA4_ACHHY|nr:hypothetical protein ACHHYP_12294 [Achlya hypogyna]
MHPLWHSQDLLLEIMSYQSGVDGDYYHLLKALRSLSWDNTAIFTTLPTALAAVHALFPHWYEDHGPAGLDAFPVDVWVELWYYGLLFGHVPTIAHFHERMVVDYVEWHLVVMSGCVDAVAFLLKAHPQSCFFETIDRAIEYGHIGVVEALHRHGVPWPPEAWKLVGEHGGDDIAAYLNAEHCPWHEHWPGQVAELAAEHGHLGVIRFLHEHQPDCFTVAAMDAAAANGHLDVVRFLHENRSEGCTSLALTVATRAGHEDVVEFLLEHYDSSDAARKVLAVATILDDDVSSGWRRLQRKLQQLCLVPDRTKGAPPKQHYRAIPRLI